MKWSPEKAREVEESSLFVNMASNYTREWIKFFKDCGIPDDVATVYALIFYENRIQKNMLLDLNKEYLKDMGITVMGDVIAVLRHAKNVHDKFVREQFLSGTDDDVIEIKESESNLESGLTSKKSTPMKRILEHYTRKYESPESDVPLEKVQIEIQNDKSVVKVPKKLEHRIGLPRNSLGKKSIQAPSSISSSKSNLEVPVPKVRRVLPENEGGYKIKMPSGSTERSKKLLEQAKKKQKTVFDRLGESSVSSTTSEVSTISVDSKKSEGNKIINKEKNFSSVFSRLGGKTSSIVTSTSSAEDIVIIPDEQLPYSGVLKSSPLKRKIPRSPSTATMRADDEVPTKPVRVKDKKVLSVKKRLGSNADSSSSRMGFLNKKDLKAIRITTDFQQDEDDDDVPEKKVKLSARFSSVPQKKDKLVDESSGNIGKGLGNFIIKPKGNKISVTSTTSLAKVETKLLKRRIGAEAPADDDKSTNEASPAKKVRFGKTTHRLIPGNTPAVDINKKLKNYPNLTMSIPNFNLERKKTDTSGLTSSIKIGSLNSDKIVSKPTVKDRIGNKPSLANRLGSIDKSEKGVEKNIVKLGNGVKKSSSNIHARLG